MIQVLVSVGMVCAMVTLMCFGYQRSIRQCPCGGSFYDLGEQVSECDVCLMSIPVSCAATWPDALVEEVYAQRMEISNQQPKGYYAANGVPGQTTRAT